MVKIQKTLINMMNRRIQREAWNWRQQVPLERKNIRLYSKILKTYTTFKQCLRPKIDNWSKFCKKTQEMMSYYSPPFKMFRHMAQIMVYVRCKKKKTTKLNNLRSWDNNHIFNIETIYRRQKSWMWTQIVMSTNTISTS